MIHQAAAIKQKPSGWFEKVLAFWKKKSAREANLKTWAANEDLVKTAGLSKAQAEVLAEFQGWIRGVTDAQAVQIVEELSTFCAKQWINNRSTGWMPV